MWEDTVKPVLWVFIVIGGYGWLVFSLATCHPQRNDYLYRCTQYTDGRTEVINKLADNVAAKAWLQSRPSNGARYWISRDGCQ